MKPLPFFGVAAQQVATHPVHVLKIEGQFLGSTADRYLQVHDSVTVPDEGAVPIKSWLISQNSPFFQSFPAGELALANGLYICVSTTDATKTLSADTMDLGVELTDPELPSGTSFIGDVTTQTNFLDVWLNGQDKTLFRLIITEKFGTSGFVFLQTDATRNDVVGAIFVGIISGGTTKNFDFGKDGRKVSNLPVDAVNGPNKGGCSIVIAEDINGQIIFGTKATILAEYK